MLTLAWRNLWRQRRRSLVTAGAVGVVVFLSIWYYSIGGASVNSLYQNLTETTGHIQVHVPNYRDLREFQTLLIRNEQSVRERVNATVNQGEVVGVLEVSALLSGEDRSRGIVLVGQDWPEQIRRRFVDQNLSAGRFLEADELSGIVLGESLARALKVGLGDEVYAYAPGTDGYGAAAYTVIGLLDLLDANIEARSAYISLPAAQELAAPDAVTRFEVHFPEIRRVDEDQGVQLISADLKAALPDYSVESWRDLDPTLVQMLEILGPMMNIVNVIFFVLAGLLVVNTVYLGLMERIHEFGVIISLGASGRKVMGMITLESVLLCITGAAVGAVSGLALVARLAQGFTFPGLQEYYASFGMNPILYASITPQQVFFSVGFAIATGILAALWPASVASRLEPVEAMRFTA